MAIDIEKLQAALGVTADGVAGIGTFTALFRKGGADSSRAGDLAVAANAFFGSYGIMQSGLRLAHLMAQLMHESGHFRYMEEIASGAAYEGREDLGNVLPGDGKLFKGRGPLQITGRKNYRFYGAKLGIDLERHPELAAIPSIGLHISLEFWVGHGLNELADQDNIEAITHKINGGYNGLDDRKACLAEVKSWLG